MKPLCFPWELNLEFLPFLPPLQACCCPHHPATLRPACQLCAPGISWGSQAVIFMPFYFLPSEAKAFLPLLDMHFLKIQLATGVVGTEPEKKTLQKRQMGLVTGLGRSMTAREGPVHLRLLRVECRLLFSKSDIRLGNEKTSL